MPAPLIDISIPLSRETPAWPGSPGAAVSPLLSLEAGDEANASKLETDVHTGTHVDAPLHFLADGSTVDHLRLETLNGPAVVAEAPASPTITAGLLDGLGIPSATERLLLRTRNSEEGLWARSFTEDFAALTADAARWVVEHGIRLIGIDYLSVQLFDDGPETHRILLADGVVILEGIDLREVEPGSYELVCLPLRLAGAEAAPARAALRPIEEAS